LGTTIILITPTCHRFEWERTDHAFGYWFGMIMYVSYMVMFAKLFYEKYYTPAPKRPALSSASSSAMEEDEKRTKAAKKPQDSKKKK